MKILVIEDESKAAEYLRQGLAESGYAVEVARNGTDGLHAAATGDHDLLILDLEFPRSLAVEQAAAPRSRPIAETQP